MSKLLSTLLLSCTSKKVCSICTVSIGRLTFIPRNQLLECCCPSNVHIGFAGTCTTDWAEYCFRFLRVIMSAYTRSCCCATSRAHPLRLHLRESCTWYMLLLQNVQQHPNMEIWWCRQGP